MIDSCKFHLEGVPYFGMDDWLVDMTAYFFVGLSQCLISRVFGDHITGCLLYIFVEE